MMRTARGRALTRMPHLPAVTAKATGDVSAGHGRSPAGPNKATALGVDVVVKRV